MIRVETGCSTIFRFDDVLSENICDRLTLFMKEMKEHINQVNLSDLPWQNDDSFKWDSIPSDYLFAKIESYREDMAQLVSYCYKETVYPHFTDLVYWRTGRSMSRHRDDGWTDDDVYMRQRAYTTVTYLNDDYTGGETFVASENGDYISVPKKGSIVILKSTPENAHGVNPVTSGVRVTLPIWFTRNINSREIYHGR